MDSSLSNASQRVESVVDNKVYLGVEKWNRLESWWSDGSTTADTQEEPHKIDV
jgi:hypothetical protein